VIDQVDILVEAGAVADPDGRFIKLPLTVDYVDGETWLVHDAITYRIGGGRTCVVVEADFDFDWASIPAIFRLWLPKTGTAGRSYGLAALFHDWLYVNRYSVDQWGCRVPVDRSEADAIFLEIMLYTGVPSWLAHAMHRAVRAGGWWVWRRRKV
jgi:hypothetical protein